MMKRIFLFLTLIAMVSCGSSDQGSSSNGNGASAEADPLKGIGEIKHVQLTDPLDQSMITKGRAIFEMKCAACHRLNTQRVVGPGFKGVTERRTPEWIMNMITNVEIMLDKDPTARALLEECLVRMPNQNLTIGDARDVLEFFRDNDASE